MTTLSDPTPADVASGMTPDEHATAVAIAAAFGHSRDSLTDPTEVVRYLQAGRDVVTALVAVGEKRRREDIAEALYDIAHEHCGDEGCYGGGKPWYDGPADRLHPHGVLAEVAIERGMQDDKWGEQNHPDGTGRPGDGFQAEMAREICKANGPGENNWRDILAEEVAEAFAETDPVKLRAELVQAAAVAAAWVECIDRRAAVEMAAAKLTEES